MWGVCIYLVRVLSMKIVFCYLFFLWGWLIEKEKVKSCVVKNVLKGWIKIFCVLIDDVYIRRKYFLSGYVFEGKYI